LFIRNADFTGTESPVLVDAVSKDPRQISRDGRLLYRRTGRGNDVWVMALDGSDAPGRPAVDSRFDENYAGFSPDGKWVVYASNESGRDEIYVTSLAKGGKRLLSITGGSFPIWRRDGREIVYMATDKTLMSVAVPLGPDTFESGVPTPLFKVDPQPGAGVPFDVSADGQHILVNTMLPSRIPPSFSLIVNWMSLVKAASAR
jgi:hypothetical protein